MASSRGLRFDGQLFFVYDREAVTREEDAPEKAILYFYPASTTVESRISICGQLVGMSNFLSTVLDFAPVLIHLKSEKVALCQSGQYTLALGSSISEPESLLTRQLEALFNIFVFYHGSFRAVHNLSKNQESFLNSMSSIWDCYLPFIRHYADTLPAVFNPLPFLKTPKNSGCFLKASHILQTCQRRHHILGGCILFKKSVLCSQLETSITRRLLLLEPKQYHLPAMQVETDIKLPYGVRILHSFVTSCEYERLIKRLLQSPYHQTKSSSIKGVPYKSKKCLNCKTTTISEYSLENELKRESFVERESSKSFLPVISSENHVLPLGDLNDEHCKDLQTLTVEDLMYKETGGAGSNNLSSNLDSHKNDVSSMYDNDDKCYKELEDEHLTMDEIDIKGLRIKTNSRENIQFQINQQVISDFKDEKIPASQVSEEVRICSELIDSLIKQVSGEGKNTTSSFHLTNSLPINNSCAKITSNGLATAHEENQGKVDVGQQTKPTRPGLGEPNLNSINSNFSKKSKVNDDIQPFPITSQGRQINLPGLHGSQHVNAGDCSTSPTEEYHDTVEDLATENQEIQLNIQATVNDILQNYRPLQTNDLTVNRYPELSQVTGRPEENNRAIPGESSLSQATRRPEEDLSQFKEENCRESGLSYNISRVSPFPGCGGDRQTSLTPNINSNAAESIDQELAGHYFNGETTDLCQVDGLVHINLYVQAHSNTVLILLADSCLSTNQDTIKALWKTTLNELGDLEVHLNQYPAENRKHVTKPDDFSFLVYEAINTTTQGNLTSEPVLQVEHKFCETAKTVHEQFSNSASLNTIILRDNAAAIHCQKSLGQEVYFHKKGPLKQFRGSPSLRDSAFSLEKRARKQLRKEYGINVW